MLITMVLSLRFHNTCVRKFLRKQQFKPQTKEELNRMVRIKELDQDPLHILSLQLWA